MALVELSGYGFTGCRKDENCSNEDDEYKKDLFLDLLPSNALPSPVEIVLPVVVVNDRQSRCEILVQGDGLLF